MKTIRRLPLLVLLAAFVLAGCASMQGMETLSAHMATTATTQADLDDAADPELWGVYADLPGQIRSSSRNGGTDLSWRWIKPGRVLQETWHVIGHSSPINTITFWRAEEPGVLHAQTSGMISLAWLGRVQPDGSVLFAGITPVSASFQTEMTADDMLEFRQATIQNGVLVSLGELQPVDRYKRNFSQAAGTQQARRSAVAPAQKAAGSAASRATPAKAAQSTSTADDGERFAQGLAAIKVHKIKNSASPSNNDDYWTYCWYQVLLAKDQPRYTFVSNLINQRMWIQPIGGKSRQASEEYKAYDGPNKTTAVIERFEKAVMRFDKTPPHLMNDSNCHSFDSYAAARKHRDALLQTHRSSAVPVKWESLESRYLDE